MAGIVRKIDNLGRIVIPKEIRESLKVKNGEAIDIELNENKIILKRHSDFFNIEKLIDIIIKVLGDNWGNE